MEKPKLRTATEYVNEWIDQNASYAGEYPEVILPAWIAANFLIERENEARLKNANGSWDADDPRFRWRDVSFRVTGSFADYYRVLAVARAYNEVRHLIENNEKPRTA